MVGFIITNSNTLLFLALEAHVSLSSRAPAYRGGSVCYTMSYAYLPPPSPPQDDNVIVVPAQEQDLVLATYDRGRRQTTMSCMLNTRFKIVDAGGLASKHCCLFSIQ